VIEVVNESGEDYDEASLAEQARFVLDAMGIHPRAELSVLLADEQAMTDLHVTWMDEPGPTDVLSFPMDELRSPPEGDLPVEGVLGDVVLCPPVARSQAQAAGHSERHEVGILLTHGILHLLGYDHAEPDEHKEMFDLQRQLVEQWEHLSRDTEEGT